MMCRTDDVAALVEGVVLVAHNTSHNGVYMDYGMNLVDNPFSLIFCDRFSNVAISTSVQPQLLSSNTLSQDGFHAAGILSPVEELLYTEKSPRFLRGL